MARSHPNMEFSKADNSRISKPQWSGPDSGRCLAQPGSNKQHSWRRPPVATLAAVQRGVGGGCQRARKAEAPQEDGLHGLHVYLQAHSDSGFPSFTAAPPPSPRLPLAVGVRSHSPDTVLPCPPPLPGLTSPLLQALACLSSLQRTPPKDFLPVSLQDPVLNSS